MMGVRRRIGKGERNVVRANKGRRELNEGLEVERREKGEQKGRREKTDGGLGEGEQRKPKQGSDEQKQYGE